MLPKSTRTARDLSLVLQTPTESEEVVYQVFPSTDPNWKNRTVINPGKLGEEYFKTHGHYHTNKKDETYKVEDGEGILILQTDDKVFLIKARAGDRVEIPGDYGHSWSNTGKKPLILLDNWKDGHTDSDYEPVIEKHGMMYYLTGEEPPQALPNQNYKKQPQPVWTTAEEFKKEKLTQE